MRQEPEEVLPEQRVAAARARERLSGDEQP
jgi:hypothetical protein